MELKFQNMIDNFPALLEASLTTLELLVVSSLIGIVLAIPIGLLRRSKNKYIMALPYAYIFFFRGTPLLVQIFLIYYGASQFEVVRDSFLWPILREAYWCAIIAFSLNTSAYIAEILRGALGSIPKGEVEACVALGFSKFAMYKNILFPRAFGIMLPAYSNEVILLLKGTALASTITLLDLMGMARTIIARNLATIDILVAAGVIYLAMSVVIFAIFKQIEKSYNAHQHLRS